ncbi:hypothetical protein [Frigoriglobus tundricola]|uniref:Uncharacterized protein n=1 Tax=Frigoriglobus tundricola TaxID=2774151 RepID=A0A6M5YYP7_9BACT|nr:hypothetical protein [Frigoriglobus tundricola]QJW98576.1 hypothetical protein FTUN_6171 [Frigoriglobus tundricola]
MVRNSFFAAVAAALVALLTPTGARAWGAAHVGYTHAGPNGVYHYGATAARGPYGAYSGSHAGAYGAGGASYHAGSASGYHSNTGSGGAYHYNTASGGAYHYGTTPSYGYGYSSGVYRGW